MTAVLVFLTEFHLVCRQLVITDGANHDRLDESIPVRSIMMQLIQDQHALNIARNLGNLA